VSARFERSPALDRHRWLQFMERFLLQPRVCESRISRARGVLCASVADWVHAACSG
jgi:hypothetical protein